MSDYYTVREVAERWSCHRSSVYDEIRAGRLRALSIGTSGKRIAASELARYERERTGVAA